MAVCCHSLFAFKEKYLKKERKETLAAELLGRKSSGPEVLPSGRVDDRIGCQKLAERGNFACNIRSRRVKAHTLVPLSRHHDWRLVFIVALAMALVAALGASLSEVEPVWANDNEVCTTPVDMMFVLDRSGSIGYLNGGDIPTVKAAALSALSVLSLDATSGVLAGTVSFADGATLDQALTDDLAALTAAINVLSGGGATNMTHALETAQAAFAAGRPGAPDVIVFFTDGNWNVGGDPLPTATAAKAAGTRIIMVGVGSGVDVPTLEALASSPASENVFLVADFADLADALLAAVLEACPEAPAIPTWDIGVQVFDSTGYPVDGATLWLTYVDGHGNYIDVIGSDGPVSQFSSIDGFGRHGRGHFTVWELGDYGVVAHYDPEGDGDPLVAKSDILVGSGELVIQFTDLVIPR